MRLVADSLKTSVPVAAVLNNLSLLHKRAAVPLQKTIKSAVANAVHNGKVKPELLRLKRLEITDGTPLKRYRPSTRGRVHPYKKRSSHIRVILTDDKSQISNVKSQMR